MELPGRQPQRDNALTNRRAAWEALPEAERGATLEDAPADFCIACWKGALGIPSNIAHEYSNAMCTHLPRAPALKEEALTRRSKAWEAKLSQ